MNNSIFCAPIKAVTLSVLLLFLPSCGRKERIKAAEDRGIKIGLERGRVEGRNEGLIEGRQKGMQIGYMKGTKAFVDDTWIPTLGLGLCAGIFIASFWGVIKTMEVSPESLK